MNRGPSRRHDQPFVLGYHPQKDFPFSYSLTAFSWIKVGAYFAGWFCGFSHQKMALVFSPMEHGLDKVTNFGQQKVETVAVHPIKLKSWTLFAYLGALPLLREWSAGGWNTMWKGLFVSIQETLDKPKASWTPDNDPRCVWGQVTRWLMYDNKIYSVKNKKDPQNKEYWK